MEYSSNKIRKTDHIFPYTYELKAQKDGKVTFVLKNVCLRILLLIRDLAALIKSCVLYFYSYWFFFIFYCKRRTQKDDL